ncbi:MAG: DNA gyrase subunit A [Pseudomonadota bacterium]|nr:DNA gyrase subunit A [Pseudomonadota bacterium]
MQENFPQTIKVNIEDEMRDSYMDYAMSVIVGRALPDARDGLKPVHRRVLYAMSESNVAWNRPYVKCARVVGDVMGKYHPHGDNAIYDALVRMAQNFSLRNTLVDGQGNFGSIDGDAPAAMRYTECRLSKISTELLSDIEMETVDFIPNYDGKEFEPSVLPSKIPNLLVNGASGIAVGMATNIPPHNLIEIIDTCILLIDDPNISDDELISFLPGPDFPTAGEINGAEGIKEAYRTGRGRVYIRGKANVEEKSNGQQTIVITELPYQVNKARLIEKIAELVREKKIDGISQDGLRDESDKDGMRIVIELKRGENSEVFLNNLYSQTQLQTVFGINIVALVDGKPQVLNLRQSLDCFINHRREVVTRRTIFQLKKTIERMVTLEGLAVALANVDEIVDLIKQSKNPEEARSKLITRSWPPGTFVIEMISQFDREQILEQNTGLESSLLESGLYNLSESQAKDILEMRLQRLTGLEQDKITNEYRSVNLRIIELLKILNETVELMRVIREELIDIKNQFGDERRTRINSIREDLLTEDLIPEEDLVVTFSHEGYAKAQSVDTYKSQRRGGRGKTAATTKQEDFVEKLFVANSHETLLCFSNLGKVFWLKVYQLPQGSRTARGKPLVNLLPLSDGEKITTVLPIKEFNKNNYVVMATAKGLIKKTELANFSRPRPSGIIAVGLGDDDYLIGAILTDGDNEIMLVSSQGKAVKFSESNVRSMGRSARGVRGILLEGSAKTIALLTVSDDQQVLLVTENGYGKRTYYNDFPIRSRGGKGVIAIQTTSRNGSVVGAAPVGEDDEVMLITNQGMLVRQAVGGISTIGRNTQGIRLQKFDSESEKLVGLEIIVELEDSDDNK